jgi:aminoglycoside 3-N-acetyltransferase
LHRKLALSSEPSLLHQLRSLGLSPGTTVVVHTAFSAVRSPGGPLGLIHALLEVLGPTGTLVMPTMSDGAAPFDPSTTPSLDMGVVAETFRQLPGVIRSTHPGASFAAHGPHAKAICAPQPLVPLHGPDSPIGRVHALHGQVLLLGVTHDANTTCHLAEVLEGVPYWQAHPCVVRVDGGVTELLLPETDHCCRGFNRIAPLVSSRTGIVGSARAQLLRSQDVVAAARALLASDPLDFLCPEADHCEDCDAARANCERTPPAVPALRR